MSKIRNSAYALAATVALGAGSMAGAAPAEAKSVCATSNVYCSMSYAKKVTRTLSYGSTGSQVTYLQKALHNLGLPAPINGRYDAKTAAAMAKYQSTRRIKHVSKNVADYRTMGYLRAGAGDKTPKKRSVRATSLVTSSAASTAAQRAVNFAYAQLGKPYVYGATGPSAYDCSGLTSAAWRAAGVSIPRTSYAQMGLNRVSRSSLQPGDIVVFYGGGHVGIYIGNGQVIHAPHTGDVVRIAPLSSMPFVMAVRP